MSEEILQPNTPVKFAARNMRPKFRRLKSGDIFLVEYEVEEEIWDSLRTVPEIALLDMVLWHHDGDAEPDEPTKQPKGPHSFYWKELFRCGFQNYPELIQVLDCVGPQIKMRLHDIFEVDSLSKVSPEQLEGWVDSEGLHSLVTLSRQPQAKVAA